MTAFLWFIHIVICALLIISVLMQSSKGGGLSGAFGGGGSALTSAFGGRGAGNFLTKATTVLAILFMLSNFIHVFRTKGNDSLPESAVRDALGRQPSTAPATSLPGVAGIDDKSATTTNPDTTKN